MRRTTEYRKSKVYDLHSTRLLFNEEVVQLDVSMGDSLRMQIVQALCNLFEDLPALVFSNASVLIDVLAILVHRYSIDVFGYEIYLLWCVD